ncbi:unnamed protein product [Allacma fusca]|uniref:Peptidase M12A domain-containing protein n=1 Tax=Allacma fusca TaxID=39272 RepID=A0A8J2NYU1_9HEXA|nr:unnamed protein product [Allacma fusca]
MAKIIFSVALIPIVLVYIADSRTCKNVGDKCKSNEDCTTGNCQERRCEYSPDTRTNVLKASQHLRLGDMKRQPDVNTRSGILPESYRWPYGTMPYELDPAFSSSELDLIFKSFRAIEKRTCVDFVERRKEKDWVYYERSKDKGCASDVGKQGGRQILNLSGADVEGGSDCFHESIIVHETLHALGFHHEQNRHDRDEYVSINWDNIACPEQFNFYKDNLTSATTFGVPYDYVSIMHYEGNEGGIDPKLPTIIPKLAGIKVGGNRLSELDIVRINRMYKCIPPQ